MSRGGRPVRRLRKRTGDWKIFGRLGAAPTKPRPAGPAITGSHNRDAERDARAVIAGARN